jgi:hypothetical protein
VQYLADIRRYLTAGLVVQIGEAVRVLFQDHPGQLQGDGIAAVAGVPRGGLLRPASGRYLVCDFCDLLCETTSSLCQSIATTDAASITGESEAKLERSSAGVVSE